MRYMIGTVIFFLLIGTSLVLSIYGRLPDRPPGRRAAPQRLDVAAARRESHALGLPFPESDGTLSLPPEPKPTPDQVHARIHECRLAAQPDVADMERIIGCLPHSVQKLRAVGMNDSDIVSTLRWWA